MAHTVPTPLDVPWTMKAVESAETSFRRLDDGRMEMTIAHEPLPGVTTAMLVWWFQTFPDPPDASVDDLASRTTVEFGGEQVPMYRLWHPLDHIFAHVITPAPDGSPGLSAGAKFELVERVLHVLHATAIVLAMDETNIHLAVERGPFRVGDLRHTFEDSPDGLLYRSRLVIGSNLPVVGRLLTEVAKRRLMSEDMAKAWFKHNVEEVGNFQYFLPDLYRQHTT